MPRNNREWAQRKIQQAIGNLEKAAGHLLNIAELYENQKVEYVSKNCYILTQALAELPDMLKLVEDEVNNIKQVDEAEVFNTIQRHLNGIDENLTVITEDLKAETNKVDTVKAKGVIDAIMIINQGLHDLKRIF